MRRGTLRLLKTASHAVTIVEVPPGGGVGEEYSIWNPGERWAAELTWLAVDRFTIAVGPYLLEVVPQRSDRFAYWGTETGPYGENDFTIVGLDTDAEGMDHFVGHTYAMFGRGMWTPVSRNPMRPPYETYHEPRLVGVGLFSVSTDVANSNAGRNHDVVSVQGLRGGRSETIKIERIPTSTEPFQFSIDEFESFKGGFEWNGGDVLQPDRGLPGFRSEQRIVMRCLDHLERPTVSSGDLWVNI